MFFLYYLRDTLQLVLAPVKGWEDVSADGFESADLLKRGLIPLMGIAALTVFLRLIYVTDASVIDTIQISIVTFLKFFATYYLAAFVFTLYLPTCIDGAVSLNKCQTFIVYGVTLLVVVDIIANCIPVELAILFLMPIYVLYILWRGIRYMNISFNGVGTFILMIVFSILLPPYMLQYLFDLVLPQF